MSGIDEQVRGIPKCPICGEEPAYWVLDTTIRRSDDSVIGRHTIIGWLFGEKYIGGSENYFQHKHIGLGDKHFDSTITEFTADHIKSVESGCNCERRYVEGFIFNTVKKAVAFWLKKEGFGSERNR